MRMMMVMLLTLHAMMPIPMLLMRASRGDRIAVSAGDANMEAPPAPAPAPAPATEPRRCNALACAGAGVREAEVLDVGGECT